MAKDNSTRNVDMDEIELYGNIRKVDEYRERLAELGYRVVYNPNKPPVCDADTGLKYRGRMYFGEEASSTLANILGARKHAG